MLKAVEVSQAIKGKIICGNPEIRIKSFSTDSRSIKPGECFVAIKGDNFDGHEFIYQAIKKKAACIIKQRTKDKVQRIKYKGLVVIEARDTIKALGDIARFWRNKFDIPVIAVTGSNGKTTTKEMIAQVLSAKYRVLKNEGTKNNHIGLPMALLGLKPEHEIAVFEIGTNHFGEIANLAGICCPNIGVITNIGPSHLEYLGDLKGVLREKYSLFSKLRHPYIGVLNADDNLLRGKISAYSGKVFSIGISVESAADFSASGLSRFKGGISFKVAGKYKFTLPTPGYYNIYNALTAVAIGRIFGIKYQDIASKLARFKFPYGRLNFLSKRGIRFIDDTYNANPASLSRALDVLKQIEVAGRRIVVMGDMMELGVNKEKFHSQAGKKMVDSCDVLVAVGELSALAAQAACASGFNSNNVFLCKDSLHARRLLSDKLAPGPGDIILVKGSRAMKMEEVLKD